jgi:hypothetical protein
MLGVLFEIPIMHPHDSIGGEEEPADLLHPYWSRPLALQTSKYSFAVGGTVDGWQWVVDDMRRVNR